MPPNLRERQVQAAARRIGLKLIGLKPIVDRSNAGQTGRKGYYELATSTRGRRHVATPLSLDDIELLIGGGSEPAGADRHHVVVE
jgi:hypothetical protein